jgi:hypothetical protein
MSKYHHLNSALNHAAQGVENIIEGHTQTDRFVNESKHDGAACINVQDRETKEHVTENMTTGATYSHYD